MKADKRPIQTKPAAQVIQQARAGKTMPAVPVLQKAVVTGEEEPAQFRSVTPFQLKAASASNVAQLLTMKGTGNAKRTDGSETELRAEVDASVATNDLADMDITARDLSTSKTNRLNAKYTPLDAGHQYRIGIEETMYKDVYKETSTIRKAEAEAKAALRQARKDRERAERAARAAAR